jgi:hypothetical protein
VRDELDYRTPEARPNRGYAPLDYQSYARRRCLRHRAYAENRWSLLLGESDLDAADEVRAHVVDERAEG